MNIYDIKIQVKFDFGHTPLIFSRVSNGHFFYQIVHKNEVFDRYLLNGYMGSFYIPSIMSYYRSKSTLVTKVAVH